MEQTIEPAAQPADRSPKRRETRRLPSPREHAFVRLRMRWLWIVGAVLLGAGAGLLLSSGPASYSTSATMRLTDTIEDVNRTKQVAQTVERVATSSSVLAMAAEARGIEAAGLAPRVSAEWASDTEFIDLKVRGTDPENVVRDANAVLTAIDQFYEKQAGSRIKELGEQGNDLLTSGRLTDDAAEAARSQGVGTALAQRQEDAASGRTVVTLVDRASEATITGLSTPVAVVLGAFVGLALSAAAALLLSLRIRRVQRASDVPVLLPGVLGLSADNGAAEVAGRFLESEHGEVAVVAMGVSDEDALSFGADVVSMLLAHGISASVVDATTTLNTRVTNAGGATRGSLAAFRVLGRSGRAKARDRLGVTTLVMVTTATGESVSLLAGQREVLAVVLAKTGRQSVRSLEGIVRPLRQSDPILVLLS